MDGLGYLEKLITDRLAAGQGWFDLAEVRGVAIGLVAAGALRPEEADQVLADLEETLKRSGRLKVVSHHGSSMRSAPAAWQAGVERPEWREVVERPPVPELRGVVSLAGRAVVVGGVTATLVSLEVWSTFLGLNLAYVGVGPPPSRDRVRSWRWRGWDDAGTRYQGGGGGGGGSSSLYVERRMFKPGPAEHARTLTLVVEHPDGETSVVVPLPGPSDG
jgi:hypothetical protein